MASRLQTCWSLELNGWHEDDGKHVVHYFPMQIQRLKQSVSISASWFEDVQKPCLWPWVCSYNATQAHFVKLVPLLLEKLCLFLFLLWNFLHYRHWGPLDSSKHGSWVFVFIRAWENLLRSTEVAHHNAFIHGSFFWEVDNEKFLVCNRCKEH